MDTTDQLTLNTLCTKLHSSNVHSSEIMRDSKIGFKIPRDFYSLLSDLDRVTGKSTFKVMIVVVVV